MYNSPINRQQLTITVNPLKLYCNSVCIYIYNYISIYIYRRGGLLKIRHPQVTIGLNTESWSDLDDLGYPHFLKETFIYAITN